ncbi:MAG: N-acetyl sugar amidotransferase [Candidatus Omnitrophica bacterium]|nr:N-acetyl sugar amidotransferase [Candidatus Omnitrophota bacterium]
MRTIDKGQKKFQICKKCVQGNTRPGIKFDDEGVCPACRFAEKSHEVDWSERDRQMQEIIAWARARNVSGYDCIVGVSGGKDSTCQALYVRDTLGLKPLLVSSMYPPEQQTERGAHNLANLISLGFDCITVSLNPQTWKKMFWEGFFRHGNFFKPSEMVLWSCLPRAGIAYHIPLIFIGENTAISLGALEVESLDGEANQVRKTNTIQGGPESIWPKGGTEQDVIWYRFPSEFHVKKANIRMIYLGYYMKEFSRFKNAEKAVRLGLEVRDDKPEEMGMVWGWESLDDDFVIINQTLRYLKIGSGKANDQASEAVRLGLMTRKEAGRLMKMYDGKVAYRYIKQFCHYLNITEDEFWEVMDRYRNPDVWRKDGSGRWVLREEYE